MQMEMLLMKELASGETCTLCKTDKGYEVDMWKENGENHWSKFFHVLKDAEAEYNRWS